MVTVRAGVCGCLRSSSRFARRVRRPLSRSAHPHGRHPRLPGRRRRRGRRAGSLRVHRDGVGSSGHVSAVRRHPLRTDHLASPPRAQARLRRGERRAARGSRPSLLPPRRASHPPRAPHRRDRPRPLARTRLPDGRVRADQSRSGLPDPLGSDQAPRRRRQRLRDRRRRRDQAHSGDLHRVSVPHRARTRRGDRRGLPRRHRRTRRARAACRQRRLLDPPDLRDGPRRQGVDRRQPVPPGAGGQGDA